MSLHTIHSVMNNASSQICPKAYNTDMDLGVCLWSGPGNGSDVLQAGWLNGAKSSNCAKTVYVQRPGAGASPIYARVVDGCGFNAKTTDIGCFQIGLTKAVFKALNATSEELSSGVITNLTWSFANEDGKSSRNGPV
ncbi:hypothetical protein O181_049807 [Austropuccinia psidii MF-1]|uniref:Uncharacterized protein n=1 Tax=Austropuccinia psidii MF-1 TaxID=1389203 RepID=A0A9Q3E2H6_9BASI|nr:hypothetical protein [Austropuccinia psidii MF-1]